MARSDSFGQKVSRRRRKAVACAGDCGETTLNPSGLCSACMNLIKDGESFRRLKGKAAILSLERAPAVQYWYLYQFRGNAKTDHSSQRDLFRDALLGLAGAEQEWTHRAPRAWHELPAAEGIPCVGGLARQDSIDNILVAPAGKIKLIQQAYQACVNLMAQAYREGYGNGENMLARLADGDLSMNDLADKAARK